MGKIIDINKAKEYSGSLTFQELIERGEMPSQKEQVTASMKALVEMANSAEKQWRDICISPNADELLSNTAVLADIRKQASDMFQEYVKLTLMFSTLVGYNPFEITDDNIK